MKGETKTRAGFTAGPWIASQGSEFDPDRWTVVADGPRQYLVATVENGQPGDTLDTEAATARLIAAAPDLLEALEKISRAEGPYSRDPLTHAENVIEAMVAIAEEALTKATEGDR